MNRLTQKDEQGNWRLKGLPWRQLHVGQPITRETYELIYAALWKLMEYEDTGLTPDEIMDGKMPDMLRKAGADAGQYADNPTLQSAT